MNFFENVTIYHHQPKQNSLSTKHFWLYTLHVGLNLQGTLKK